MHLLEVLHPCIKVARSVESHMEGATTTVDSHHSLVAARGYRRRTKVYAISGVVLLSSVGKDAIRSKGEIATSPTYNVMTDTSSAFPTIGFKIDNILQFYAVDRL